MKILYNSLMGAARAHAQWEIETSFNIIGSVAFATLLFIST